MILIKNFNKLKKIFTNWRIYSSEDNNKSAFKMSHKELGLHIFEKRNFKWSINLQICERILCIRSLDYLNLLVSGENDS